MPNLAVFGPSKRAATSATNPNPNPNTSPTVSFVAIAVVAAFAGLALLIVMFITFRRHQQRKKQRKEGPREGEIVSRSHPAALMITSADGSGTPRFVHTPGTNMRTAVRRSDGGWEFAKSAPSLVASDDELERRPSSAYAHSVRSAGTAASGQELVVPQTAASASPWGPPVPTPRTSTSEVWRSVYSPAAPTFLDPTVPSSRRNSGVSEDSFQDNASISSATSNPFRSPAPSVSSRRQQTPSPLSSPPASTENFRVPPHPVVAAATPRPNVRQGESRAAREIRLGYEALDRMSQAESSSAATTPAPAASSSATQQPQPRALPVPGASRSPTPSSSSNMSPAAKAKEAESRAARAIRQGYNEDSEYPEFDDELPAY